MDKKSFYVFGILLLLTTLSESGVIVRRGIQNFANSGNGEIPYSLNPLGSADKPVFSPEISNKPTAGDDFGVYEYDARPFDYDYEIPGEVDKKKDDEAPEVNPEKFPSDTDHTEGPLKDIDEIDDNIFHKNHDTDNKLDDDDAYDPFDDDSKGPVDEGDLKPVEDEHKYIPKDEDETHIDKDSDDKHEEDDSVKKDHDEDEGDKKEPEDEKDRVPEDEDKDVPKDDDEESKDHDENENDDDEESKDHDENDEKPEKHDVNDDEKSEHDENDDEKSQHDENDDEKSEHDENDDEKSEEHDEDEKFEEHEEDEKSEEHDKGDEDDDKDIHEAEEAKPFSGGSIFDTPFFNYERVKNYFGLLDKALGQNLQETLDEAELLNGTYANTTEEEVDIDGKKYIVQKSVIKSADNHSTIYVETLSTKPKVTDTEEVKNTELKNATNV